MNIREELREEKATQHRIPARSPLLKCPPFSQGFVAPESVDWMQM